MQHETTLHLMTIWCCSASARIWSVDFVQIWWTSCINARKLKAPVTCQRQRDKNSLIEGLNVDIFAPVRASGNLDTQRVRLA
jgi:hypothetical protein